MDDELNEILKIIGCKDAHITKASGGQINRTYQVGGKYFIKIQNELDVLLHQIPLIDICVLKNVKVAKIIASGIIHDKQYLVLEKIPGQKLTEIWDSLSFEQKDNLVKEITNQLKVIHSISFTKYSPRRPIEFVSWKDAVRFMTDFKSVDEKPLTPENKKKVDFLKEYFYNHIGLLDEIEAPVMVHNDFHFGNILVDDGKLTGIIDFDFARQAPKEYELWHLIDFLHTPKYFVEAELETEWAREKLDLEIDLFKKHYPELFSNKNLLERLRLYFIDDMLFHLSCDNVERFNKQFESYYTKDGWLERLLK